MTIDRLRQIAAAGTDGKLTIYRILSNKEGHHYLQWQMTYGGESWYLFVNPPGKYPETLAECIQRELDEIEERITMDIFGTKLFPYIAGEMLAGKGVITLTIKDVRLDDLKSSRGSEEKPVVYFKERDKGLILNKTNAKRLAALYGRETNDWRGKKIGIYAEQGEWFGQPGFAIRVADKIPANGKKNGGNGGPPPPAQDELFDTAPPRDDELAESQNGDGEDQKVYANGTVVKKNDGSENEAFDLYIETEGHVPPSRAELERWVG